MAQLTDDCFAFGGALMPVEAALALIAERIMPVAPDSTLAQADGRVVAADILSPIALPPFANSAVDGYAVRHVNLPAQGPTELPLRGRVAARVRRPGSSPKASPSASSRVRRCPPTPTPCSCRKTRGRSKHMSSCRLACAEAPICVAWAKTSVAVALVLPAGRRMKPQDVALAAAVGLASIEVRRRLRVALFSTGDELVENRWRFGEGAIHDSNRLLLSSLLYRFGAEVVDLGILRDDRDELAGRLAAAARGHDLVLPPGGGVSTGEEDHVKAAVETVGKLVFWRLGIKPGRPIAMGMIEGVPFAGLPGNPVAVFVTFCHVVRRCLHA